MNDAERSVFCSGCYDVFPESQIHVVPTFNDSVGYFVDGYRCEKCWQAALDEVSARIQAAASIAALAPFALYLERHSIFLHEFQRRDPPDVVRPLLLQMIEMLRAERLKLRIGPARPA